jgi:hypothetical protein
MCTESCRRMGWCILRNMEISASDYMRQKDVDAFKAAAHHYKLWILLRQSKTVVKERGYIGKKGYVPKRLDCKAKTADRDVRLPGLGEKKTAGLVVNAMLDEMADAFDGADHLRRAKDYWWKFKTHCYFPRPGENLTYFPGGKFYSVQMDRSHAHFGCVMFSAWSNVANASYVHSDYDLFGMVREDDPAANVRVPERRLGEAHNRGREFFDVQHFLNRRMGVAMVLHGEQEKYSDDVNDVLDVFWPDGVTVKTVRGAADIRNLYQTTFKGRPLYGKDGVPLSLFGLWQVLQP